MFDSYIDFSENGWVSEQKIDVDKANDTADKVVKFQGYLTQTQAIYCLCGKTFDEVIDYDVRIWNPKTKASMEWIYPI